MTIGDIHMGVNFEKLSSREGARQIPIQEDSVVPSGLGHLVASYADGLPVQLLTVVQKVIR